VGIRERSDIHVIDRWRFLGTARNDADVHELLQTRLRGFEKRMYLILRAALRAAAPTGIVDLCEARPGPPGRLRRYASPECITRAATPLAAEPDWDGPHPTDGSDEFG
jgi:hypothetical protein